MGADGGSRQELGRRVDELAALYRLTNVLYRSKSLDQVLEAGLDAIVKVLGDRASILLFDDDGVMQFAAWRGLSEAYRTRLAGHTPWKPGEVEPDPIFVSDIDASDEPDWIKAQIRAEGIRGLAFIPLLTAGGVSGKFMSYYREPHVFDEGERNLALTIARQIGFSLEKLRADEARRVAIDELRESEARFRIMAEEAPVMIWTSGTAGQCLYLNAMLRDFWGVADLDDFDWGRTMHPGDGEAIAGAMIAATRDRQQVDIEGRYRRADGEYRVLRTRARPRFSPAGEFLGMIGVNVDITERKQSDAQRDLLLAELNHRVKNTLAVVQGIAHQTFRNGAATPEARSAFEGRLLALSNAHSLLTRSHWENAALARVAADTFANQGVDPARVSIAGPAVELPARQALGLSLALHELCTNALKYGALSNEDGRITLGWAIGGSDGRRVSIAWTETGGPPVTAPERQGFGSRLIRQVLSSDLDAEVSMAFEPAGLVCTIVAPIPGAEDKR